MEEVFKTGWIQTQENGVYKDVAPKTLADLVYMDVGQTQTVKDALANIRGGGSGGLARMGNVIRNPEFMLRRVNGNPDLWEMPANVTAEFFKLEQAQQQEVPCIGYGRFTFADSAINIQQPLIDVPRSWTWNDAIVLSFWARGYVGQGTESSPPKIAVGKRGDLADPIYLPTGTAWTRVSQRIENLEAYGSPAAIVLHVERNTYDGIEITGVQIDDEVGAGSQAPLPYRGISEAENFAQCNMRLRNIGPRTAPLRIEHAHMAEYPFDNAHNLAQLGSGVGATLRVNGSGSLADCIRVWDRAGNEITVTSVYVQLLESSYYLNLSLSGTPELGWGTIQVDENLFFGIQMITAS